MTEQFEYSGHDLDIMSSAKNYNHWILAPFYPYIGNKAIEVGAGQGTMSELIAKQCSSLLSIEPDKANYDLICSKLKEFKARQPVLR